MFAQGLPSEVETSQRTFASGSSLWTRERGSLLGDRRAVVRGDILTVVIEIDDQAEFSNSSDRSRSADQAMAVPQLLGFPQRLNTHQEVRVNFELRELIVSGFVRPADISRMNEVTYDKIASARISYGGRGQITDVQQPTEPDPDEIVAAEYAKLDNQFVVPIVEESKIGALVVLTINIEVPTGGKDIVLLAEPKLRDRFLEVLFEHANIGGFSGNFTSSSNMRVLREDLLAAARRVVGLNARDILILDIVRQDVSIHWCQRNSTSPQYVNRTLSCVLATFFSASALICALIRFTLAV